MLAQGGQTPDVFKPVKRLAIKRLVKMSRGAFTQEMLDDLVRRAAGRRRSRRARSTSQVAAARRHRRRGRRTRRRRLREWTERINEGRFTGQTVIVTGAGSGIGRATASRVAREGGRVIAVDVSQERLDEFVAEHAGADIVSLTADITDDAGHRPHHRGRGRHDRRASRTSPGSWTT